MPDTVDRPQRPCPPIPDSDSPEDLEFEAYKPMVRWFSPGELVRSGLKAVLSSLFGAYADKREIQALQGDAPVHDYSTEDEVWFDYVADLGDGFDSTHTIARLLAQRNLKIDQHETRRGRLLIMGGDQVYPTSTRDEYNNRLVGPYRSALPCVPESEQAPDLFAIPGNHDWYDGLTSFTRLFCQERWIGGWKTRQQRGYFAIRLSEQWWLWGIDIQLAADVDEPQLNYFHEVARDRMRRGSSIVLCTAEPSWAYAAQKNKEAYDNLAFFERKVMAPYDHHFAVGLAGDLHTYARYEQETVEQQETRKHRFISGGGGAYLYPSHNLPPDLDLPRQKCAPDPPEAPTQDHFSLNNGTVEGADELTVFPSVGRSRALAIGSLLFAWRNKSFAFFLGAFYLFFSWLFESASLNRGESFLATIASDGASLGTVFSEFLRILVYSPSSAILLLLLTGGLIGFADAKNGLAKVGLGIAHALMHIALIPMLMWLFVRVNVSLPFISAAADAAQITLFAIEMLVIGGFAAGFVMGIYLILTNLIWGIHGNEVFLCQSLPDYKNFLRLHLDEDENLTIYPVGVERVIHDWKLNKDGKAGDPWFTSETWKRRIQGDANERAKLVRLIEHPIIVRPLNRTSDSIPIDEPTDLMHNREESRHEMESES